MLFFNCYTFLLIFHALALRKDQGNFPKGDIKKVLGKDAETFRVYLNATNRMTPREKNVIMSGCFMKTVDDSKSYDEFLQILESSSPNEKMQQMAQ